MSDQKAHADLELDLGLGVVQDHHLLRHAQRQQQQRDDQPRAVLACAGGR